MVKPEELDDGSPAESTPARPSRATPARNERSGLTHKPLPSVDMALLPHERRAARSRQVTLIASLAMLVVGAAAIALARPWMTAFFKGEPMPKDGKLQPPDKPGWGVELDRERVVEVGKGK